MRSEISEYERLHPPRKYKLGKGFNELRLRIFKRCLTRVSLGSEKWLRLQHRVSLLSSSTFDCRMRSAFYEMTMGDRCKGAFYCLPHVCLNFPNRISLGYNLFLNRNVNIVARDTIKIGDNVIIGPNTIINSGSHNYRSIDQLIRDQGHKTAPIVIGDDVFIGGDVFVLPGVKIGDGAVVGAGSVVTKSVDPFSVVAGVPAAVIGRRE